MMSLWKLAIIPAVVIASAASADPFGVPQGTPVKALHVKEKFGVRSFVIVPPKPNSNFKEYIATATPPHGVCALTATSATFSTFDAAYEKQAQLEKLLSIYGKARTLGPGPDQDWLNMKPGQYPVRWSGALPYGLRSIELGTVGNKGAYKVELTYRYKNVERCVNWEPQQNRDGL
jgi:hypothetical protein